MRATTIALSALALFLPAAHAQAATVSLKLVDVDPRAGEVGATVSYRASRGQRNRLTSRTARRVTTVTDPAGVRAGRGCRRVSRRRARCREPRRVNGGTFVRVFLGDRADTALVIGARSVIRGGPGPDLLRGFGGSLLGEAGADRLVGRDGENVLVGGAGRDTMSGGTGLDEVSYAGRRRAVRADLDGDRDDGDRGERDLIGRGVEILRGGRAGDVLIGDDGENGLAGGEGTDVLSGAGGDDQLSGGNSLEALDDMGGADQLDGGEGDDQLLGSAGPNRIVPGPGRDSVEGSSGSDKIFARDDYTDDVSCDLTGGAGGEADHVELDRLDYFPRDAGCETVARQGAGFAQFLGYTTPSGEVDLSVDVSESGALVGIGCPADGPDPCTGEVELLEGSRRVGSAGFSRPRGEGPYPPVAAPLSQEDSARADTREGFMATLVVRTTDSAGVSQERRIQVLVRSFRP